MVSSQLALGLACSVILVATWARAECHDGEDVLNAPGKGQNCRWVIFANEGFTKIDTKDDNFQSGLDFPSGTKNATESNRWNGVLSGKPFTTKEVVERYNKGKTESERIDPDKAKARWCCDPVSAVVGNVDLVGANHFAKKGAAFNDKTASSDLRIGQLGAAFQPAVDAYKKANPKHTGDLFVTVNGGRIVNLTAALAEKDGLPANVALVFSPSIEGVAPKVACSVTNAAGVSLVGASGERVKASSMKKTTGGLIAELPADVKLQAGKAGVELDVDGGKTLELKNEDAKNAKKK